MRKFTVKLRDAKGRKSSSYSHSQNSQIWFYRPMKKRKRDNSKFKASTPGKSCSLCHTSQTPQWRTGSKSERLCNACGLSKKRSPPLKKDDPKNQTTPLPINPNAVNNNSNYQINSPRLPFPYVEFLSNVTKPQTCSLEEEIQQQRLSIQDFINLSESTTTEANCAKDELLEGIGSDVKMQNRK